MGETNKSKVPTSLYQLSCDTFDTKLEVKMHQVNGVDKILISIENSHGQKSSISIFKEEVNLLSNFLQTIKEYTSERNYF